jgi:nucleoside-diphosphate-sugar epimerase
MSLTHLGGKRKICVLLIGGGGYVGQALVEELCVLASRVVVLDQIPRPETLCKAAEYYLGDAMDKNCLLEVAKAALPDVVLHLSSYGMSGAPMLDSRFERVNVSGIQALLDVCAECGIQRIVYTSSYNVIFGGQEIRGGNEDLPYYPLSKHTDYCSKSKAIAEALILQANGRTIPTNNSGSRGSKACMMTTSLRPAAVYGEGERHHFPRIIKLMDNGLFFFTVGCAAVDWVHIENLAQAFLLAIDKLLAADSPSSVPCGRAYFINDGAPVHSWEFLRPLAEARGCEIPSFMLPVSVMIAAGAIFEGMYLSLKPFGIHVEPFCTRAEVYKVGVTHYYSITRARLELGYSPTVNTTEGSRRVAAYYGRLLNNQDYFRFAPLVMWVLVVGGMAVTFILGYELYPWNDSFRTIVLNPLLRIGLLLFRSLLGLKVLFWTAVLAHILEAFLALQALQGNEYSNTWQLWFLQTLFLGYPSLKLIYERNRFMTRAKVH